MTRRAPHADAHGLRRLSVALVLAVSSAVSLISVQAQTALPCGVDLKLLVLSADGQEAVLPAITRTLDYLGTPYLLHVATASPGGLTEAALRSGCRAFYHGVLQTTASLAYSPDGLSWQSALTPAERDALIAYETEFDVRQVNWYAFPNAEVGLFYREAVDTSVTPLTLTFTTQGKAVFPYLTAAAPATGSALGTLLWGTAPPLRIASAYTYLADPIDALTVPLITEPSGGVVAAVRNYPDGREALTMTFDGNPNLTHSAALGYGVVNWVTRGMFIGDRHVYMSPQVDDIFLSNDRWLPTTPCGTAVDGTGNEVRMTGVDHLNVVAWQRLRQLVPLSRGVRLTMAYNGSGTTGVYRPDTLTPSVKKYTGDFHWVSHTYTHPTLDTMSFNDVLDELVLNRNVAKPLRLSPFSSVSLVTPNVSGLLNADAMRAIARAGIRYVVSDTSRPGYDNPFPNVGIQNPLADVYMIPRRPNNLFFNVVAPADWESEYNCLYEGFWGRPLSYAEILDIESSNLLGYMLRGEMDPWMFHQPNLVAYRSGRSLLTDLLDRTLAKYAALYNLPVLSPAMDDVGRRMQARGALRAGGVTAYRAADGVVHVSALKTVSVPITGLQIAGAEIYGGQPIATVAVKAGRTVRVRGK